MSPTDLSPRATLSSGGLLFRPGTVDDAAFRADVETAVYPDEPADPKLERHWEKTEDPSTTVERWIVLDRGTPIGYVMHRHPAWERTAERYARTFGELLPAWRDAARLRTIHALAEARAISDGAEVVMSNAREDDPVKMGVLEALGYVEKRRSKRWELDLRKHRERLLEMAEASRRLMREEGIELLTLDRSRDPDTLREMHATYVEAGADIPRSSPYAPQSFEVFLHSFDSPALRRDRIWVAWKGADVVGHSMLEYPPVRGPVWTAWTGTARSVRGKGVARALKLETIAQAIAFGVTKVRTDNDGENAPIVHLNEVLGYERVPGWLQVHKQVRGA